MEEDCPFLYQSPNAPSKRDVLGTLLLSILAGHKRYAHITLMRCGPVNPVLFGMERVMSENSFRRAFRNVDAEAVTSRPLLLYLISKQIHHAGQTLQERFKV